jgi:hypothetical protein
MTPEFVALVKVIASSRDRCTATAEQYDRLWHEAVEAGEFDDAAIYAEARDGWEESARGWQEMLKDIRAEEVA